MIRRPPRSTRTDTLFPYTTLFRSHQSCGGGVTLSCCTCGSSLRPDRAPRSRPKALSPNCKAAIPRPGVSSRSEEHTSELQSLMRISYAVFCLKKKKKTQIKLNHTESI